jgi:quercetin dioxygenase-like cupin family protein
MTTGAEVAETQARYIAIDDVAYEPAAGCARTLRKRLLDTERLEVRQTVIRGSGVAEDYGVCAARRAAYVLSGVGRLTSRSSPGGEVRKGQLIVIPAGARWGEQLCVLSDELVLLEIAHAGAASAAESPSAGEVVAIRPEDVPPYEPAGHAKTQNRCLFVDEHVEIIEGLIDSGGGAERHSHRDHEQLLYVLSGRVPLLIHYPRGAPHGTGGGITEPLELLVIYSPPLGESRNALG